MDQCTGTYVTNCSTKIFKLSWWTSIVNSAKSFIFLLLRNERFFNKLQYPITTDFQETLVQVVFYLKHFKPLFEIHTAIIPLKIKSKLGKQFVGFLNHFFILVGTCWFLYMSDVMLDQFSAFSCSRCKCLLLLVLFLDFVVDWLGAVVDFLVSMLEFSILQFVFKILTLFSSPHPSILENLLDFPSKF